jgi:hypothetical protein
MISPRYAAPVAALLALALVPTVIHSYRGAAVVDGLRAEAIPARLGDMGSSPINRRPGWVKDNFDTDDWIERTYKVDQRDVRLFVGRSYDAKRLYHHPELALLRGTQTTPGPVAYATARPDVPLHTIETSRDGRTGVAVYALLYDGSYINNPILFQLKTSAALLVSGRRPLTLFMASDLSGDPDRLDEAPATRVLLAAIEAFERQQPSR